MCFHPHQIEIIIFIYYCDKCTLDHSVQSNVQYYLSLIKVHFLTLGQQSVGLAFRAQTIVVYATNDPSKIYSLVVINAFK